MASLRAQAKQSSDFVYMILDCFVASAPRNDRTNCIRPSWLGIAVRRTASLPLAFARASVGYGQELLARRMDCRVKPGNDVLEWCRVAKPVMAGRARVPRLSCLGEAETRMPSAADSLARSAQAGPLRPTMTRKGRHAGWANLCRRRRGGRILDDIEVNSAAADAAHGPVFVARASADHAQHPKLALAIRAIGPHRIGQTHFRIKHGWPAACIRRSRIAG